jgi:hypothetical protein
VLDPPINGETASSAAFNAPYFTGNPGDSFKAWDGTVTYDYMPVEWYTLRFEYGHRRSNVPCWAGHGGVTPPALPDRCLGEVAVRTVLLPESKLVARLRHSGLHIKTPASNRDQLGYSIFRIGIECCYKRLWAFSLRKCPLHASG